MLLVQLFSVKFPDFIVLRVAPNMSTKVVGYDFGPWSMVTAQALKF